jgi:hypothetical protein
VARDARKRSFLMVEGEKRGKKRKEDTTRKTPTCDAKKVVSHHKPRLMTPVVMKTLRH